MSAQGLAGIALDDEETAEDSGLDEETAEDSSLNDGREGPVCPLLYKGYCRCMKWPYPPAIMFATGAAKCAGWIYPRRHTLDTEDGKGILLSCKLLLLCGM
jgi:hypothetical protein